MAVRFKFRSSATFDSVDLQGRPSISVRDLKSKILLHKHLTLCQDFDLVFSDSVTGQEYHDEHFQIPSGSSVIVKRVPAGSTPSVMPHFDVAENLQIKDAYQVNSSLPTVAVQEKNVEVDDFDDFGIDLCPVPETAILDSNLDIDEGICLSREKGNIEDPRCSDQPMVGCQKLELSDLSDAISRGPVHGIKGRTLHTKSKLKMDEQITSGKGVKTNPPAIQTVNLPSELKCSLCDSFFQNAVMIPCCQHSFCEQCIRRMLIEEARCPKCFSTKCGVQDLLPNISLRQAIEHFLESQILVNGSDNGLNQYAPDGESGIQAKEVSCAASVFQPDMLHSSSATGRGSNQIMGESSHIKHSGSDKCLKPIHLSHNMKQVDGGRLCSTHPAVFKTEPEGLGDSGDFQGENQPMHEEAESTIKKKKGFWVDTEGGGTHFMETGRHRKGERACYMCGSLDHLIRDCPVASSPHPMLQAGNAMFPRAMPGFVPPYWNGSSMAHVPPFPNLYSNPGMMHFNAPMTPSATFATPTFMPAMYGGLPTFGFTRAEGVATPGRAKVGGHVSHPEFLDLQHCEKEWKLSSENRKREQYFDYDDDGYGYGKRSRYIEAERSSGRRSHMNREKSLSCSNDSSPRVSWRKHHRDVHLDDVIHSVDDRHEKSSRSSIAGRDQKPHYRPEGSSSDVEDIPSSSVCHSEEKHKNQHRIKRHNQKKEQDDNDSGRSRHQRDKEKDVKRKRVGSDIRRQNQKLHSRSESGLEPNSSDTLKRRKEKESSHSSKRSKHDVKSINNEVSHDRWQMITDSVDDEDDYRYYKQRRVR